MGLQLFTSIWFTVTVAHCTFFGGLWLVFKHVGLPTDFIENAVRETVHQVLREAFDTESLADSKGLIEPETTKRPWSFLLVFILIILLLAVSARCWFCGICPLFRERQGRLSDSPRSPQPELAVIARQQLAEIRLRRHAH